MRFALIRRDSEGDGDLH